jgi:hypothetical protein
MSKARQNMVKLIPDETIIRKIYIIRGQKVMLDFDLAALYGVETRALNQAVKRNIERFPEDFMFRLTSKEWANMISQIVISSPQDIHFQNIGDMRSQSVTSSQGKRKISSPPYAFTEHGVTMLASVLKSERAAKMCIAIVRVFIELKRTVLQYDEITKQLQTLKETFGRT